MKYLSSTFLFLLSFSFCAYSQSENKNLDKKGKRVKTTWTGNGFFHAGIRPGNWELDQFGATPGTPIDKNGIHGSPTPVYLSVEQIGRFVYWNMDMSTMLGKKDYEYTSTNTTGFFKAEDIGQYQSVQASFLGSVGYLWHGRVGAYVGGRIGYDNTLVHYNLYTPGGAYMSELGGTKKGYNFHFFFPFIRGMMRIGIYTDVMTKGEFNFKATTHEAEFNYYLPFNKTKSAGLMLRYNHMSYSTTNYLTAFNTLNGGAEINYKRSYFQIGFIIPIFKELAPDACVACSGKGRTLDASKSTICTACNGKGGTTCTTCGGEGRIYSQDRTNSNYCPSCHGSGTKNCMTCGGTGHIGHAEYKTCEVCHGSGKKAK